MKQPMPPLKPYFNLLIPVADSETLLNEEVARLESYVDSDCIWLHMNFQSRIELLLSRKDKLLISKEEFLNLKLSEICIECTDRDFVVYKKRSLQERLDKYKEMLDQHTKQMEIFEKQMKRYEEKNKKYLQWQKENPDWRKLQEIEELENKLSTLKGKK